MDREDNPSDTPVSVEDDIRAAMAELSTPAEERQEPAPRERDDTGRFASKETSAEPEIEAGTTSPAEVSRPERLAAPEGWPADAQTQWDKLPRRLQDALEADLKGGKFRLGGGASDEPSTPDPLQEAVRSYEADAKGAGLDSASYVRNTLSWARAVSQNPQKAIRALAKEFNVDLTSPSAPQPGATAEAATNPDQPWMNEIQALKSEITQERYSRAVSSAQAEVDGWASEKDASGNPMRPHYSQLDEAAFAARLTLIRQREPGLTTRESLQRAYDAEVYAHEPTRRMVLDGERKAAEAARQAEAAKAEAERARTRSSSVTTNRSALATADKGGDAGDETVEQTLRRTVAALRNT